MALRAHKGQHVCGRLVEALQPRHVNNAVAAGDERVNGATCLGSVAELAQGRAKLYIHCLKFRHAVPDQAHKAGTVFQLQTGGQFHGPHPVAVLEHLHSGARNEVFVHIIAQLFHIVHAHAARYGSRLGAALEALQLLGEGLGIGGVLVVAVRIVRIGEHAGHVSF